MKLKSFFKPNPLTVLASGITASLLCSPLVAPATVLFSDDFNTTSSSTNWTVNVAPTTTAANQDAVFAFDYSALGIPPAPGSSDTLGMRLRPNIPGGAASPVTTRPAGTTSGLSVSPTGKDFGTSYHLSFYAWINFNGAANASGLADNGASEGGTINAMFAVGTSGTVPMVVGNTGAVVNGVIDGIGFATTGDGGITSDYRVYPKSGTIAPIASGDYAAGTANDTGGNSPYANVNLYYQAMPSLAPHTAPTIQTNLSTAEYGSDAFNTQLGSTQIGSFGFAWHRVDIYKSTNIVKWAIDNTAIATVDVTSLLPLGGNNIAIGTSDVNSGTTRHPSLLFTLIDNLAVTDITAPSLTASRSGANVNLSWPEATGSGYALQYTTNFGSPTLWSNVTNFATASAGTLSVNLSPTNAQTFFRLKLP